MIYPSIDKILTKIESKYILVHIVSKRCKQMMKYKNYQMPEEDYYSKKEIGRSLEEIDCGLLRVKKSL